MGTEGGMRPKPVIHLLSGGLDSTVLLYDLVNQGCNVHCILFDYGQKHAARELSAARAFCLGFNHGFELNLKWTEVRIPQIKGSSLTDGCGSIIVPNRNAILLSVAVSLAVSAKAEAVTYACNKDDAADFPDCRREFVEAFSAASVAATGVEVCAPYLYFTKREVVHIGRNLGAPLDRTWSCYEGTFAPCGLCGACVKRSAALR
jgi:7-cyano-7-deazaguanine synthase